MPPLTTNAPELVDVESVVFTKVVSPVTDELPF